MLTKFELNIPANIGANLGEPSPYTEIRAGEVVIELGSDNMDKISASPGSADVVISAVAPHVVRNKEQLFKEIFRVLKPYGRFSVSDIVVHEKIPPRLKNAIQIYMSGESELMEKETYLELVENNGFMAVQVTQAEPIDIPFTALNQYLSEEEIRQFEGIMLNIQRITVVGEKSCCGPTAVICTVEC